MIRKWLTVLFLTAVGLVIYATAASAQSYYVVSSGTNGDGTSWSSPWVGFDNIQWGEGAGMVGAGDTLFISGGTTSSTYRQTLVIGASGTADQPLRIAVDYGNPAHGGVVTIDLDKAPEKFGIDYGSNSYVVVDGYNPSAADQIGIKVTNTDYSGVTIGRNASHNTLRYVEQSYAFRDGIWLNRDGGHNLGEYCKAHDNTTHYAHGILLQSGDYNTIRHCESYDNEGSGFHTYASALDPVLDPADYETFEDLVGYRNGYARQDGQSHGIYISGPSSHVTVKNSTFYQNGGAGIQLFAGDTSHASTGNIVTDNECYDNGYDSNINFGWGIVVAGFNSDAVVQRNKLHHNRSHGLSVWDMASGTFTDNTMYNNGFGRPGIYGTDGDYAGSGVSSSVIDRNTYSEYSATLPLINWMGTVYTASTADAYKTASGKDVNSTFETNSETPPTLPTAGGYSVSYPAYSWTDATTKTQFSDFDEGNAELLLPFDFTFFGETYAGGTAIKAFVNGGLSFDPDSDLSAVKTYSTIWPSKDDKLKKVVAPWYQDMYSKDVRPAVVYTAVTGTAPNRVFVIAWKDMADAPGNMQVFEVKLFETSNAIEFHYQTLNFTRSHVPGLNKGDGVDGILVSDADLGSGKSIRFTPASPEPPLPPTPSEGGGYSVSYPTYSWTDATTTITFSDIDEGNAQLTLPFDFTLFQEKYAAGSTVKAFVNGGISFDPNSNLSAVKTYSAKWPSSDPALQKVIAPWYQDLYSKVVRPAAVYTAVTGTAPNRVFVIAWKDMADAPGNMQVFEVKLFETSNAIEFHYQTLDFTRSHVPGLNKGDGVDGILVSDADLGNGKAIRFTPISPYEISMDAPVFTDINGNVVEHLNGVKFIKVQTTITKIKNSSTPSTFIIGLYDKDGGCSIKEPPEQWAEDSTFPLHPTDGK